MRIRHLLVVLAIAAFAAGCSDDDGNTPPPTATATRTVAPTNTATVAVPTATNTVALVPTGTATVPAPTHTATAAPTNTATAAPTETPTPESTTTATPSVTATEAPRAVARRISDPTDLITGPLAHGQIGDYLLANDVARFIIQDAPKRDMYSVGAFGGNIIDVELRSRPGLDNFLELQPAVHIETVINAQTVEIVNDGSDGNAAIIRTCGPDDVLDFVNPSTIIEDIGGLTFPANADDADYDVEGCTEYSLEVGKPYVKMVTTIMNNEDVERGFFIGDYINAAGQVEQWTSTGVGLGEILTAELGVLSYIGYGEATGVDYSHVTVPIEGSPMPRSSFFTAAGVSYVLHSNTVAGAIFGSPPTFIVPPNGSNSLTRYFGVGDGSGGNAIALENEVKNLPVGAIEGCVSVGGEPAVSARVVVGTIMEGAISGLTAIYVTGEDGCYAGVLPPGDYGTAAARQGAPYENNSATPVVHPITATAGGTIEQNFSLPDTGSVRVTVTNETGAAIPARIGVIGFDPSPDVALELGTRLFNDPSEAFPFGFAHIGYTDADGVAEFDLEPGSYQLVATRGVEYSAFSQPITVTAGNQVPVAAQIARVVDTTGFISSDYHVHGIASADSRVPDSDRVRQYAGEGVDDIIMTDHHAHTDLTPVISALEFTPFVHATIGEEITTWDYGHFNAYPLTIDPSRPSGGSTDWGIPAEPGRDFKAYGAFGATPAQLEALAIDGPTSTPDTVVQINHIDSHFDPLRIDTSLVPPQSVITAQNRLRYRLDPNGGNLFHHFKALEVWNGAGRGKQAEFIDLRLGIWFNHLNQGLITTAIADTDSHQFLPLNAAGARTWTASPTDNPAEIDPARVAQAVLAGRAVGGEGVYVQTRLLANDGSGAVADLTLDGATLVSSTNGNVTLEINAQAPLWAPFDRVEIYANANSVVARTSDGVPTLFGAEPTLVLAAGDDFTVTRENVVPAVPGAERLRTSISVPFPNLEQDTWFVVIVKGTNGISQPMFPALPEITATGNDTLAKLLDGNLGEAGVLAMGYTNALYADVDGEPGFQALRQP